MNCVFLMGRLTNSPEIRNSNNTTIAMFSIAVDRRFKKDGDENADFFRCICFGKLAEFTEKYLNKGTKIVLSGRVENDNYVNKNGEKVYGTKIIAESIEFAESKQNNSSESQIKPENKDDGFMNIPDGIDEQLPFN